MLTPLSDLLSVTLHKKYLVVLNTLHKKYLVVLNALSISKDLPW